MMTVFLVVALSAAAATPAKASWWNGGDVKNVSSEHFYLTIRLSDGTIVTDLRPGIYGDAFGLDVDAFYVDPGFCALVSFTRGRTYGSYWPGWHDVKDGELAFVDLRQYKYTVTCK